MGVRKRLLPRVKEREKERKRKREKERERERKKERERGVPASHSFCSAGICVKVIMSRLWKEITFCVMKIFSPN